VRGGEFAARFCGSRSAGGALTRIRNLGIIRVKQSYINGLISALSN
jgi:hypothetical protein